MTSKIICIIRDKEKCNLNLGDKGSNEAFD